LDLSQRLDRLPITAAHRLAAVALAFAYFFELADLNTFSYAAPGIVGAWGIPVGDVAFITATSFGGMFIGGTFGGMLADRIGRKRAFILSILVYATFSLLNGISWDVLSLAAFRFLTGIGLSAMTVTANVYISELFPARLRGRYMSTIFTIGLVGIPATSWVAYFAVPATSWGWRLVFVWGALGMLALPLALRLTESPRWLASKGRHDEALRAVEALERMAGTEPPPRTAATSAPTAPAPRQSYGALFDAQHRLRTLSLSLVWIFQTMGFYGFVAWVPTLLVQHGFTITKSLEYSSLIAICNPVGAIVAMQLIERVERKWLITVDAILIAVVGVAYGLAPSPLFIVIFGMAVIVTLQLMNAALYTYTPEAYPTDLRSAGTGLCYGLGRLANVAGPFIISMLYLNTGYLSVFVFISGCWLVVAAVVAAVGPRTTGRALEAVDISGGALPFHHKESSHV
jgi:MFS transporter, putative metabolite:H+ symporter